MAVPPSPPTLASGIPDLDVVLGGGIPRDDVLLLVGPAGSGKTTLALQFLFHAASGGLNALYVSTVSEPTTKLLRHLRPFAFYDERLVGRRLFLLNVYPLVKEDLGSVARALEQAVKEHQATVVVVDGLMSIRDLHPASLELRSFIYELGATLAALSCTVVVTSSGIAGASEAHFPELTMADGILELGMRDVGTETVRTVRVTKLRGRAPLLGQHAARIDERGLSVFPRIESVVRPLDVAMNPSRLSLGLPELDQMMGGGPRAGSVTLLAGSLGTGKTLTGLHFLMEGVGRGETGVFVGFRETPRQLVGKARDFGLDLGGAMSAGRVAIIHRPPVDLAVDEVTWAIRSELERLKPARVVVDNLSELERARADESDERGYMAALAGLLEGRGVTALLTKEIAQVVGPELDFSDTPLAALAENLLLLRWVEYRSELFRILSVLKMRDSPYDSSIRQYVIDNQGIRVLGSMESAEGLLTGIARLPAEARRKPRGA